MTENGQPPEVTKEKQVKHHALRYGIDDTPPWYECIGLGFQSFLTMMGGLLAAPLVVASALCIGSDDTTAAGEVVSTTIFVSGLVTLLQSTLGSRLPIVQGGSFAFMAPLFAVLALPEYACVSPSAVNQTMVNGTGTVMDPMTWQGRMQVLQGCLTIAALLEIVVGFIGGVGLLIRFIGPITIAPTILLIGMSLAHVVQHMCATQWWIAIMTTCLLGIFSQVMNKVTLHGVEYLPGVNGKKRTRFFQMYAVMITIIVSWSICAILTATNVLPSTPGSWGYEARTDIHIDSLYQTPWFRFPYPGQFGRMTFNVAGIFGMMIAIVASVLESVGDYHACAKICGAPPPPVHAINRGIFMEGIGCLISGLWGVGIGSTSFSENIGAIGLTRVASRRVIQVGAILVVFVGMFGKIGALLGTIPSPVLGGILLAVMGMICSIGISNLQTVDLNSMRNMFIVGIAFFTGIVIPPWVAAHKDTIKLGNDTVDRLVVILLTTSMTVGAVIAFTLDNLLPGTVEERGLHGYREVDQAALTTEDDKSGKQAFAYATYDMPFGMSAIRKLACLRYIPISPTYGSKPGDRVNNPEMNGYSNGNVDLSETSIP